MRLTQTAIKEVNTVKTRVALASALGFSEQWIIKLISQNKENGPLTTVAAVKIIERETGLAQSQILEAVPAKVA